MSPVLKTLFFIREPALLGRLTTRLLPFLDAPLGARAVLPERAASPDRPGAVGGLDEANDEN